MFFKDKWALITGGAKRLGADMALALANEGCNIILHYFHSDKEALSTQQKIQQCSVSCKLIKADLSDQEQRKIMLDKLLIQELDILVNSASIFPENDLWSWKDQDLMNNMSLHVSAPRDLASLFKHSKKEGSIINMIDCRIQDYDSNHVAYHLSKKALQQLTRMLALELAPWVRVNAIAPGLILPPPGENQQYMDQQKKSNLMN
ncbi:MAG: SDR family NAD(P)-dependent oxidoreductase [Spirochaetaceae bacterium]|nr:SDR family NAD(P)-dependent oxidoreductase [Spirochaetaceae bacterium]